MEKKLTLPEMEKWFEENNIEYREETYSSSETAEDLEAPEKPSLSERIFDKLFSVEPMYTSGKDLIIESNNGKWNLNLSFGWDNSNYVFTLMTFGNYMFDIENDDFDLEDASELISSVIRGDIKFISEYGEEYEDEDNDISDIDECYDMTDPKERNEYQRKVDRIHNINQGVLNKMKNFLYQMPQKYEIYDWNTYECIEKQE